MVLLNCLLKRLLAELRRLSLLGLRPSSFFGPTRPIKMATDEYDPCEFIGWWPRKCPMPPGGLLSLAIAKMSFSSEGDPLALRI